MRVKIERLGHMGDGIAAGPVFVPLALPGEEVEGVVIRGRMSAARILQPSTDRVRPDCVHFKRCGGCLIQHAADGFVAKWKRNILAEALTAQGLVVDVLPTLTSPSGSRRRATLTGKRTKNGALIGFHARASDTVVEIEGCVLLHPDLMTVLPALRALTIIGTSRKAEIGLTITRSQNGVDVAVKGGKPLDGPLRIKLAALASTHGLARLVWEDDLIVQIRPPEQRFGEASVTPPAGAFLQATSEGEQSLVQAIIETVSGAKKVVDLFSGCGTFSLPVAKYAEVHAVENAPEMLAALDRGWRHATGLKQLTTETRDLFRRPLLADELARFDAIVIDPPRAGAQAQFHAISQSRVPVIASISCNPASFARDARCLVEAGYRLDLVQPVDQFRWSEHLEISARFTLA